MIFIYSLKGPLIGLFTKKVTPLNKFANYLIAGMLLGISFFLSFLDLAEDMLNSESGLFDQAIISGFTSIRNPLITEIMKLITAMGSPIIMIIIALISVYFLFIVKKHSWDAGMLIIALTGATIMDWILKLAFHRHRPLPPGLVPASGYSFPSGHAMVSFVFYGMLIYLLLINFNRSKCTYLSTFFLALLVLAIGISRIYLGVHYPSDVIAGYAAGGFWLTGCIMGLHTVRHLNSREKAKINE
ncbi:MAG: phosphatase PAP2 family protein [Syntrophomonas sp.]|nr:phosphatase PAP2 family protein [Syntrophomonas sp.]